jgi:hypothetical protein
MTSPSMVGLHGLGGDGLGLQVHLREGGGRANSVDRTAAVRALRVCIDDAPRMGIQQKTSAG